MAMLYLAVILILGFFLKSRTRSLSRHSAATTEARPSSEKQVLIVRFGGTSSTSPPTTLVGLEVSLG